MTKSEKIICGFIPVFLSIVLWPSLPQISLTGFVVFILFFAIALKLPLIFIGMISGFIWASACGYYYIHWQFDHELYHQNLLIEGEVSSLMPPIKTNVVNVHNGRFTKGDTETELKQVSTDSQLNNPTSPKQMKFNFIVQKAGTKNLLFSPKIRLSWFAANLPLQQGDKLRLFVKLKPASGLANPDGFDYQTWLTSKNIVATGYVKNSPSNQFLASQTSLRQQWVNRLRHYKLSHIKWILALSYGDRSLLQAQDWALMQRTGTAHLFAISGMHLGIVFACVLVFCKGFTLIFMLIMPWSITNNIKPWLLLMPAASCIGYALIAGFEIPVLRALFTLLLCTILVVFSQYWRFLNVLLLLLMSFFVLFPYAILGISFWFSFMSVLIIVFYVWRFPLALSSSLITKIVYGIKLQLFISFVTLPVIAYTFSSLPIISFLANLFMIPIVTFVLVPSCLLGAILLGLGIEPSALYWFINESFSLTFWLLSRLDNLTLDLLGKFWQQSTIINLFVSLITHPLSMVGLLLMLLPDWPKKQVLITCIFCLGILQKTLSLQYTSPNSSWTLYAMDVGQGSALIVTDEKGTMLIDTGGSFNGFSMANTVLMPFFKNHQITNLEYVLLSHFDNDHAGGLNLIEQEMKVQQVLSPRTGCNREDFLRNHPRGKATFMSLSVEVLWPLTPNSGDKNNQSCVLKFEKGNHSILLTGDIEKQAETQILKKYKDSTILNADVLVAPHHGSKTSSTHDFVRAVAPKFVIFTSGNQNRWGFPSQNVVNRYQSINAEILITGRHGRIKVDFDRSKITVSRYRVDEFRRWYYKAR